MIINEEKTLVDIEDELKNSYLDYAMSVIIGRALPDVRDGLKPVHRRILYAMHELGLLWNKPFKKSARVVGEVLGKYHPHGDASVYDSICRMVQNFSLRYPLIDGQGNFGSVDGDSPAAMRYTEVRLSKITQELLKDIEKETVKFVKNFDESLDEPSVLPAIVPNLLINGSSGIAVGMATNIPPHNITEVINALIFMIDNTEVLDEQLFEFVKGPDFPTAGIIYGKKGILEAYKTGRGIIKVRGRAFIERDDSNDRETIIISQIPYQVNKARLLETIGELINEKKIEGIHDLRDESDRDGMRIVIEIKRNERAQAILNYLYKHTALETSFGIIMLAVVENQPRILSLRDLLKIFISYRKEIIIKRIIFDLRQAEEKAHILEGLKKAVDHIDRVIEIIRSSKTVDQAKETLMLEFSFSPVQAKSILEMRLQRLTGMEREALEKDISDLYDKITYYKNVLANESMVMEIIREELISLQGSYSDQRLTEIVDQGEDINYEDTFAEQDMVVTVTHRGYIKRTSLDHYKIQRRRGIGVRGVLTQEQDFTTHLFVTTTHNFMFFFSDLGRVFCLKIHQIPETGRSAKGTAIVNLLPLQTDEKIAAFLTFKDLLQTGHYLVMATKKGLIKRSSVEEYKNMERFGQRGIRGLLIGEDDKLVAVKMTNGDQDIFLGTKNGKFIRFSEKGIRPTGRVAGGIRGISVEKSDELVDLQILRGDNSILTVTENGYGKRTAVEEYRGQNRGGKGHKNINLTEKNGQHVIGIKEVLDDESVMIITKNGKLIWIRINEINVIGRDTQGVKLIELDKDDKVVSIAVVAETETVAETEIEIETEIVAETENEDEISNLSVDDLDKDENKDEG